MIDFFPKVDGDERLKIWGAKTEIALEGDGEEDPTESVAVRVRTRAQTTSVENTTVEGVSKGEESHDQSLRDFELMSMFD